MLLQSVPPCYLFGEAVLQVCVVARALRVGGVRRPDGHAVGEVGLRLRLLLRLPLVEGILQSHVGQNDATRHSALGRRASEALKVLVHAILPEGRLNGPGRPATYEGAAVLPLQHLHLGHRGRNKTPAVSWWRLSKGVSSRNEVAVQIYPTVLIVTPEIKTQEQCVCFKNAELNLIECFTDQ